MTDDIIDRTPSGKRRKDPRTRSDRDARERIDLDEELGLTPAEPEPEEEVPAKPAPKAKKPAAPKPPPEPEEQPELGRQRWTGSGPIPSRLMWDAALILLAL